MVLAEFLNTSLLEPHKRRLRAEGHTEGRAETLAEVRSALLKAGINLDDYLSPAQESEVSSANRC